MKSLNLLKEKKYRLILILLIIFLFFLFFKINQRNQNPTQIVPIITPTIIISPSPAVSLIEEKGDPNFQKTLENQIKDEYPLFKNLPYGNSDFVIQKYLDVLILEVILKKDTPEVRQQVLDWISSKGVDPTTHTIIWKAP